jgi:large subunit ribosomal protein L25
MAEVKLNVERREDTGKGAARRSRAAGKVPAIVYGEGMEATPIQVDRRELVLALKTDAGMNVLLDLQLGGDEVLALTRELQRDPVRGTLLHADFVKVDRTREIEIEVPIHVVGEAPGVKEGGVLEHPLFTVHVRCLPTEVPESIDADVSALNIGDVLRISELSAGLKFTILNDPDAIVAAIAAPISEAELEAMEAAAGIEAEPTEAEIAAAAEAEGEAGEEAAGEPAEGESSESEAQAEASE